MVIGIDIGGTKINGIVWDGKKIVRELTIVTPKSLFEFERNLLKLLDFLSSGYKIKGLGVGMAGAVNSQTGIVHRSPNIKFVNKLNLVNFFKLNGFKTIMVDNDANCFTRAEMTIGQGKYFSNFLALTLGTGVGGGIVINGQLYRGKNNHGGELGHILVNDEYLEHPFKLARDKNNYKKIGELFGKVFVSLIKIFAPEAIILGGSVSLNSGNKFLPFIKKEIKKFLPTEPELPKILVSKLKHAGAIGAALMLK